MIIASPHNGKKPKISPKAFVAKNATIIGDVTIEDGANIWFGAVLRGDVCKIHIGKNTSIQDNCVLHSELGTELKIGENCIIGHSAMVHGPATIGNNVMIGIGAIVLQGTTIKDNSIIAAGAVARKEIEEYSLITGVPGKLKKKIDDKIVEKTIASAYFYAQNGKKFKEQGHGHSDMS